MNNSEPDGIRIVIVEDHPIYLDGLRGHIQAPSANMILLGEADRPLQALELIAEHVPDVVLFDLQLRGAAPEACLPVIDQIKQLSPNTRVIVLTAHPQFYFPALRFGASAYLLKTNVQPEDVRRIIREVHAGTILLDPEVAQQMLDYFRSERPESEAASTSLQRLTRREREILKLIVLRRTNPEIARDLVISVRTVKTHVSNMLEKLNLSNREQLRMVGLASKPHGPAGP